MNYVSRWPLFIHMISACLCLGFSAVFHLCYVYSHNVGKLLAKLDYAGIIILIYGSSMPPIHYYFSCGELIIWRNILTAFLTVISLITFCVTLLPTFEKSENRKYRGMLFVALGISAGFTLGAILYHRNSRFIITPEPWAYAIGGAIYIFGAFLYVTRVPERCRPGKHNIFGASH
jgi:adiponectin receptor